ncbi:TetR family transcriptional regulator [Arenicella chitinivorans]|uniref:TetR family transcriptional regulator n=1 Tax=Arenicella chitinivorans TaxID=1329800 RepID=A0A918VQM6_9GAMM|nr:TetR/AcrR family transcriptional regulator [Arenicella chitinivorans]GHA15883.1 TetR family transcriptional regulator [Arenicella chitinivorans]
MTSKLARTRTPSRARAGRPRDSSKHQAILQATRELVNDVGYRGLTLKAIASKASVTRNVLYNWWDGDINRIVEEALLPNVNEWAVPDNGSFAADIDEFLDLTIEAIYKPDVLKGFLTLAAEIVDDQGQLRETSRYFRAPYARLVAKIVKQAEARDEICANLDPKHLAQMISGSVLQFAISKNPGRRNTKAVLSTMIQKIAAK